MIRDWRTFWKRAIKSLRYSFVGTALVPIYFVLINPNFNEKYYWNSLLRSTRIGFQISILYWLIATTLYVFLFWKNADYFYKKVKAPKFQLALGIPIMALGLAITSLTEPYISGREFDLEGFTTGMLIGGITFIGCVMYSAYRSTTEQNLKLRAESAENSLHVLKNQMQPHFLFNSLNSLSELIESDKEHAAVMTQKLSDLYRKILENSKAPLAPLASEVEIIKKYLDLEKLRFGDRLSYKVEVPKNSENIFVPSLTLQTLVENAVKHGISQSIDGGEIHVRVKPGNTGFHASIENTGNDISVKHQRGTGIENTCARLNLLYGSAHNFKLQTLADKTVASFWFKGVTHV